MLFWLIYCTQNFFIWSNWISWSCDLNPIHVKLLYDWYFIQYYSTKKYYSFVKLVKHTECCLIGLSIHKYWPEKGFKISDLCTN